MCCHLSSASGMSLCLYGVDGVQQLRILYPTTRLGYAQPLGQGTVTVHDSSGSPPGLLGVGAPVSELCRFRTPHKTHHFLYCAAKGACYTMSISLCLYPVRLLCLCWLLATGAHALAGPPRLMLATVWQPGDDPTGWWMSEKYEEVRGYWDGKRMLTRCGEVIALPDAFLAALPPLPVDRGGCQS